MAQLLPVMTTRPFVSLMPGKKEPMTVAKLVSKHNRLAKLRHHDLTPKKPLNKNEMEFGHTYPSIFSSTRNNKYLHMLIQIREPSEFTR